MAENSFRHPSSLFSALAEMDGNKGCVSYVPIPFEKRCLITAAPDNNRLYYQVTYMEALSEKAMSLLRSPVDKATEGRLRKAAARWRESVASFELAGPEVLTRRLKLEAGHAVRLLDRPGPGLISQFLVTFDSKVIPAGVRLRAWWDRETRPSIDVPLAQFFGQFSDRLPIDYAALAMAKRGNQCLCRWPMPYATHAFLELENKGAEPVNVTVALQIKPGWGNNRDWGNLKVRHISVFRATERLPLLRTAGRGHYVGCLLAGRGPDKGSFWMEGDEEIWVDGEPEPKFLGTGTEDYFNGAWGFPTGPYSRPLHGLIYQDDPHNQHVATMYRFHLNDAVPFKRSIQVELERGAGIPADYEAVAFWYQAADSVDNTPPSTWGEFHYRRTAEGTRCIVRVNELENGIDPRWACFEIAESKDGPWLDRHAVPAEDCFTQDTLADHWDVANLQGGGFDWTRGPGEDGDIGYLSGYCTGGRPVLWALRQPSEYVTFRDGRISFAVRYGRWKTVPVAAFVFRAKTSPESLPNENYAYFIKFDFRDPQSISLVRADGPGKLVDLDRRQVQLDPERWYGIDVKAAGPKLTVFVDGTRQLSAEDNTYSRGSLGPQALVFASGSSFDDIRVRPGEFTVANRATVLSPGPRGKLQALLPNPKDKWKWIRFNVRDLAGNESTSPAFSIVGREGKLVTFPPKRKRPRKLKR